MKNENVKVNFLTYNGVLLVTFVENAVFWIYNVENIFLYQEKYNGNNA